MPSGGGNSCLDEQIERLKRCEYLREGEVKALCLRAREILVDESNVQRVDAPVTVSLYIILLCLSAYTYAYRCRRNFPSCSRHEQAVLSLYFTFLRSGLIFSHTLYCPLYDLRNIK